MPVTELEQRLDRIERRLLSLENAVGLARPSEPAAAPEPSSPLPPAFPASTGPVSPPPPPPQSPAFSPARADALRQLNALRAAVPAAPGADEPPAPPTVSPAPILPPAPPTPSTRKPFDLERLIGAKFFMSAGALVVVAGVALFLKVAYDAGWLGMVPPAAKVGAGLLSGVALLAFGELALRRLGRPASAGLSAAGVGAVYASLFAAHAQYGLVGPAWTFALLVASALLGVAVAVRAGLLSVAILSLVGGYLTPLLLRSPDASPVVMPVYLLSLMALGLGLSIRDGRFAPLRAVVWWATLLLGGAWGAANARDHALLVAGFAVAVWLLMHAELVLTARREPRTADAAEDAPPSAPSLGRRAALPLLTSVSTTLWSAALAGSACAVASSAPPVWTAPAAFTVLAALVSFVLAGHLRILTDLPRTGAERLGAALLGQAAALLIATVATALSGPAQAAAWLAMGLGGFAAGRWIRSRPLDVYGAIILAIATLRILLIDSFVWHTGGTPLLGLVFTPWTPLALSAAGAWIAAAAILHPAPRRWRALGSACAAAGVGVAAAAAVHPDASAIAVAAAWALLGLAALAAANALRRPGLAWAGVALASLSVFPALFSAWWRRPELFPGAFLNAPVGPATLGLWATAAALLAAARAHARSGPAAEIAAKVLAAVGVALAGAALYTKAAVPAGGLPTIASAWGLIALGAVALHRLDRRLALDAIGAAGLLASAAATGAAFIPGWFDSSAPPLLHRGLLLGLALAAACVAAIRLARARWTIPGTRAFLAALAVLAALAATTLELARVAEIATDDAAARGAAVSLWWALAAAGLIVGGFLRRVPPVRWCGLALLGVAGCKVVIADLATVAPVWRAASFVGVGLLMLAVALLYARSARALRAA